MTKSKVYVIRIETFADYSELEKEIDKINIVEDVDLMEEYEGSIDDGAEEYSVVKHEIQKYWYIWDNVHDEEVCDEDGNPERFDTQEEAEEYIKELMSNE